MAFKITNQRNETMLKRIGSEAAALIDDQRFLPFYRGVQIKLEKAGKADEWGRMIATAKGKENPKHYFAKLCRMVRDGTYIFVTKVAKKVKEVAGHTRLFLSDKLVKYGFGKYQKFYVSKAADILAKHDIPDQYRIWRRGKRCCNFRNNRIEFCLIERYIECCHKTSFGKYFLTFRRKHKFKEFGCFCFMF